MEQAILFVRRPHLSDDVFNAIGTTLQTSNALYVMDKRDVRAISVPQGLQTCSFDNVFNVSSSSLLILLVITLLTYIAGRHVIYQMFIKCRIFQIYGKPAIHTYYLSL